MNIINLPKDGNRDDCTFWLKIAEGPVDFELQEERIIPDERIIRMYKLILNKTLLSFFNYLGYFYQMIFQDDLAPPKKNTKLEMIYSFF